MRVPSKSGRVSPDSRSTSRLRGGLIESKVSDRSTRARMYARAPSGLTTIDWNQSSLVVRRVSDLSSMLKR